MRMEGESAALRATRGRVSPDGDIPGETQTCCAHRFRGEEGVTLGAAETYVYMEIIG